jgi:aerobic-type carbon monoxide dehydrogenase small subunit (CoxS/CutS family)
MNFQIRINGKVETLTTDPNRRLLDVLREDLGLTGTKFGCGEGQCRACTVLLDGKAVASCQTTIEEASGARIETIEGLEKEGQLHPVQQAFLDAGAMQCGYCVPGMIMCTVGLLRQTAKPTHDQTVAALNGNLCRCCGYRNILKAVDRAAQLQEAP